MHGLAIPHQNNVVLKTHRVNFQSKLLYLKGSRATFLARFNKMVIDIDNRALSLTLGKLTKLIKIIIFLSGFLVISSSRRYRFNPSVTPFRARKQRNLAPNGKRRYFGWHRSSSVTNYIIRSVNTWRPWWIEIFLDIISNIPKTMIDKKSWKCSCNTSVLYLFPSDLTSSQQY